VLLVTPKRRASKRALLSSPRLKIPISSIAAALAVTNLRAMPLKSSSMRAALADQVGESARDLCTKPSFRALLGGRDPREIVRTGTSDALHRNRTGQILCSLQALAAAAALRDAMPDRLVVAGYSAGEVAAWGVAGFLSMIDTLDLVARRAEVMDAASPPNDGLLFVRGLCRGVTEQMCERHDAAIAIVNPGNAFILG
jgi:malonyl CoA-acyl carrier protein transacylase